MLLDSTPLYNESLIGANCEVIYRQMLNYISVLLIIYKISWNFNDFMLIDDVNVLMQSNCIFRQFMTYLVMTEDNIDSLFL